MKVMRWRDPRRAGLEVLCEKASLCEGEVSLVR